MRDPKTWVAGTPPEAWFSQGMESRLVTSIKVRHFEGGMRLGGCVLICLVLGFYI